MHPLNQKFPRIILASASPRRIALLRQIGLEFDTMPSCVDENPALKLTPVDGVRWASRAKAQAIAETVSAGLVIGADTVVVLGDEVLGKPRDLEHARHMLMSLSGRWHEVITGITILQLESQRELTWAAHTMVEFRKLDQEEIDGYLVSAQPLDKAGAYGIQEQAAAFVIGIEGCYFNVVGLPLAELVERLKAF